MATKTEPIETPTEPPPASDNRFFTWMRGLGLTREPGWIGGVCAGIAARLGIDPLIVRGIVVVVAVLGGPAFLLYAAGWLLLPDSKDKIHLEELFKGRLESPIAGIGVMLLFSLLPVAQGFWYAGGLYWGEPSWGESLGRVFWTLGVLALIVWFVVWMARRAARADAPTVIPATTDDRPDTIPQPAEASADSPPAGAPEAPAAGAPEEEVAAWRVKQDAWKAERERFRTEAAATARETARQRAAEARQRSAAASAEVAESIRRWRAANPRVGAAYTAAALGAAALAGGIAALISPAGTQAIAVGFAVAAGILGLTILIAGLLRRRSGFLSFVSVLVLVAAAGGAALPADRTLIWGSYGVSNFVDGRYFMPVGDLYVTVDPSFAGRTIDVLQGTGSISVDVIENASVRVEIISRSGPAWLVTFENGEGTSSQLGEIGTDGAWRAESTIGTAPDPVTLRIWQQAGSITINDETTLTTEPTP